MKLIGFMGACDKSNLIMYLAKLLTWQNEKVLVVDGTRLQKMRYLVPNINQTKSPYITDFEGIDFAIGFNNIEILEQYLGTTIDKSNYTCMLVDTDSAKIVASYGLINYDYNFFVTTFDLYSLKRGIEILNIFNDPINVTKVISRYQILKEDEEYFNQLAIGSKVNWSENTVYLPNDSSDTQEIEENQKISRIKFKRLSKDYQNGIIAIAQIILNVQNPKKIKRNIRA